MDVTDSYHRFNSTVFAFCKRFQNEILEETGIHCTIGIGSNMLLSKVAMDIEAKHSENGIAEWRYQDVPENYGQFNHLEILGINKRTEKKLNKRGIFTIGDLAKYPYHYLKEILEF